MGGYLSEPIKDKESLDFDGDGLVCGASSMQGWRATQEDDHNCMIEYDRNASFFAVYDGHGGHEVAEYAAKFLPDYIRETEAYKAGDYEKALIDAFLGFDATLTTPSVITVLKQIANSKSKDSNKHEGDKSGSSQGNGDEEEEEEENLARLCKEAVMPLDQLIDGYRLENSSRFKFSSPNLRLKKGGPSTSGAGASSSSEANGDDGEVSSSSNSGSQKSNESSSSLTNGEVEVNGEVSNDAAGGGESSEAGSSSDKCNGETVNKTPKSGSGDVGSANDLPDSSSQLQNEDKSVTSSNGEVGDASDDAEKKITSSSPEKSEFLKRITMTRKLLCSPDEDSDSSSEDETFEGGPEESSDDEEGNGVEGEDDDEEEEEEDDDDDDDDDEEEEDDVDPEEEAGFGYNEEPGADSGCTAVVALLTGNNLYVANAGDSRCVVCREGQAVEMSIDHKPEDKIEMDRIVAAGGKVSGDGRVNGGLNLSRALGDHTYKQVTSLPATEQMITALPDVKKLEIDPVKDEFIVLACDGIWNFMSSQDVVDFIRPKLNEKKKKVSSICEELFDHCLAPDTMGDGTGCDNMTCIIVKFKSAGINGHEPVKRSAKSMEETADESENNSTKRQKLDNKTPVADAEVSVDK